MPVVDKENIELVKTKDDKWTIKITCEGGHSKTLHSIYNPGAEAKSIVSSFQYQGEGIIVVLGLGLGYHVAEIARRFPEARIIVIEAVREIYELAKEHGPHLDNKIELIIGQPYSDVIQDIARTQTKEGIVPLSVFPLNSSVSAFPEYYRPIVESLNNTLSVKLWDRLKYDKFKEENVKVILIDTGYFLLQEIEKSLKHLGHMVLRVSVMRNTKGEKVISRFIEAILDFRPDLILTINHLGFDKDGILTDFFRSIKIPVASWYVDSPTLIVGAFDKNVSPYSSLFMWDKSYINKMTSMGFESVKYLPMGTDEDFFKPFTARKHRKKIAHYVCDVGFVGNSLFEKTGEKITKVADTLHPVIDRAAHKLSESKSSLEEVMEKIAVNELQEYETLTFEQRLDVEAAILWKATLLYRLSCVERLKKFNVCIHGDTGWSVLLDRSYTIKPPLHYYKDVPSFYNACKINFNATHLQMSEAVNQRVFDVPACGAFLLTDYQAALDDLFHVGKEIITYKHKDEIPEIVKFYMKYPREREKISLKGRERVLKEHTYKHRLKDLISSMRKRYA